MFKYILLSCHEKINEISVLSTFVAGLSLRSTWHAPCCIMISTMFVVRDLHRIEQ